MELNKYIQGDCFDYLPKFENNSVDLIFTSCPDISQTPFSSGSIQEISQYKDFQQRAIIEFSRIIKKTGFVVICQTDRKINAAVLSNHYWYMDCLYKQGMNLKDYKIVVRNEVGKKDMYHFTFQHMLIFTYDGTFKRSGEFLKDIIVDKQEMVENQSVWSKQFCSMVIENLTKPGQLVVDPFAGVGPVLYAAKDLNRKYWGCEIDSKFYKNPLELL